MVLLCWFFLLWARALNGGRAGGGGINCWHNNRQRTSVGGEGQEAVRTHFLSHDTGLRPGIHRLKGITAFNLNTLHYLNRWNHSQISFNPPLA